VAVRNAQDGINVVQTADGALAETGSILQRMYELVIEVANTGSLDRIAENTRFGSQKLLDGGYTGISQADAGAGTGSTITVDLGSAQLAALTQPCNCTSVDADGPGMSATAGIHVLTTLQSQLR
jgi:flagellin